MYKRFPTVLGPLGINNCGNLLIVYKFDTIFIRTLGVMMTQELWYIRRFDVILNEYGIFDKSCILYLKLERDGSANCDLGFTSNFKDVFASLMRLESCIYAIFI
jgi:hypothetical protein